MRHVLQDPAFFHFLTRIDEEFAAVTRLGRCPGCEGPLHVADYPRKPRGCPAAVREDYSWRLSFTCGRCDGRATSPSVRFAGPPCVFGGGVDVVLTAGQFVGSSAVRFVEYPGPHVEALADVVAQGFSIDAVLAVGA